MALRSPAGTILTGRKTPCPTCPWRESQAGKHPQGRYPRPDSDRSQLSWGCHTAPTDRGGHSTQVCAGYLKSEDLANPAVRFSQVVGMLPRPSSIQCDEPLYPTLAAMLAALPSKDRGHVK